jgi:hypothetical protein
MNKLASRFALVILLLATAANSVSARELALLIGISAYDNITHLTGPRNDIAVMWRLLKEQGFKEEDMVVLADGVPGVGNYPKVQARPTRTAIVSALKDLAERARSDDFIYIHVSAHGSEQPVQPGLGGPQPWNRNQVMLPIDVTSSTDGRTIPNGIPDYEMGTLLDAVRAKAGRVWIVIDMCHAGTATRGDLVARYVDPSDLNIRFAAQPNSQDSAARGGSITIPNHAFIDPSSKAALAPMVAFFAVDPTELSFEKSFPGYDPPLISEAGKQDKLGVFTYLLSRSLRNGNNTTYRDLRNEIMRELSSGAVGAGMPLPMFEGALDGPIFGLSDISIRKGWPASYHDGVLDISAGAVQGLTQESIVVIHRGTSDKAPQVGRAKVEKAQAATSRAALETENGVPILANGEEVWITLAEEAVSFVYKISELPSSEVGMPSADVALAAITKLKKDKVNKEGIAAEWISGDSDQADFRLRVQAGAIWITQSTGSLITDPGSPYSSPRVEITNVTETADKLFNAIWSLARSQNLVRLASRYPTGNLVSISVERYSPGTLSPAAGESKPEWKRNCREDAFYEGLAQKPGIPIGLDTVPSDVVPEATQCDMVAVRLRNLGSNFVDTAVLYVDARGGVQAFPAVPVQSGNDECSLELPPGANEPVVAAEKIVLWDAGKPSTAGTEYVVVIAVERTPGGAQTCFNVLTQPTLEGARDAITTSARGPQSALQSLLNSAAAAQPEMRGASGFRASQLARSTVAVRTLNVTPNHLRMAPSTQGKP